MAQYLIIARSSRSLVESAKRGGYTVHSLDCFADSETREHSKSVQTLSYLEDGFDEEEVTVLANRYIDQYPDLVAVLGTGYELNAGLITKLERCLPVVANCPETLHRLKDPDRLSQLLKSLSIHHPAVCKPENTDGGIYLIKDKLGTGGTGVQWYELGKSYVRADQYVQEYLPGRVLSAVFLADGSMAKIVGLNLQMQMSQFIGMPFLYLGAIGSSVANFHLINKPQQQELDRIVNTITREVGLFGLCGLDFILTDTGDIAVIEINPRPPATSELHESDDSLFRHHLSCFNGEFKSIHACANMNFRGHAILYANEQITIVDGINWPLWVRDRPVSGSVIPGKRPVCSVYAEAGTIATVEQQLAHQLIQIESMVTSAQNAV